jgi:hypothetical protein
MDANTGPDVMQICRNGHVITARLRGDPATSRTHCDRCGATTLSCCSTCGVALPGALSAPGLVPIGSWAAPRYCATCGAAFPWVRPPRSAPGPLTWLDPFLRRLPLAIRQLRWRQGERAPHRVEDERDLEDLVRALLPLYFDDVRLESRTPRYSPSTRTDLLLAPEKIALTVKLVRPGVHESQLGEQWKEDIAYYRTRGGCRVLIGYVYDPEGLVYDPRTLETAWSERVDELEVRCIVGGLG